MHHPQPFTGITPSGASHTATAAAVPSSRTVNTPLPPRSRLTREEAHSIAPTAVMKTAEYQHFICPPPALSDEQTGARQNGTSARSSPSAALPAEKIFFNFMKKHLSIKNRRS